MSWWRIGPTVSTSAPRVPEAAAEGKEPLVADVEHHVWACALFLRGPADAYRTVLGGGGDEAAAIAHAMTAVVPGDTIITRLAALIATATPAQGIEAGTGETREAGLDAKHESAVPEGDAPK